MSTPQEPEVNEVVEGLSLQDTSALRNRRSKKRLACNFQRSFVASDVNNDKGDRDDDVIRDRPRLSQKHDLTPKSKSSGQPQRKRTSVSGDASTRRRSLVETYKSVTDTESGPVQSRKGPGVSGQLRQEFLQAKLLEGFEQCDEKEVEQSIVLHYLKLTDSEKSLATRAVLSAFPSCSIKRVMRSGRNYNVYKKITRKHVHVPLVQGNISQIDDEIKRMQAHIGNCDARIQELWSELMTHLEQGNTSDIALQAADQYKVEQSNRNKYTDALVKLYEIQVQNIHHASVHLNAEQQQEINVEMKKLEELSNKGYRTGKFWTDTNIPNDMFVSFLDEISRACPLITSIFECLVVSSKKERNIHKTAQYKLLRASQSLVVLLNIRNSRAMNDFVLLFGMLCISYGAGKQFI